MWTPSTIRQGILNEIDTVAIRTSVDSKIEKLYKITIVDGEARIYETNRTTTATFLWSFQKSLGMAKAVATEVDCHWEFDYDEWKYRPITENTPWFFTINEDSELLAFYGDSIVNTELKKKLDTNVDSISAVRAWKSSVDSNDDLGLIVAYIKNQEVKYRQLINGNWKTAVILDTPGIIPINVAIARSNDFRALFVIETQDYGIYLYSTDRHFMAMSIKPEHLKNEVTQISNLNVSMISILYHKIGDGPYATDKDRLKGQAEEVEDEYLESKVTQISNLTPKFLRATNTNIEKVENIPDEEGNWGTTIKVTFDYGVNILSNENFTLISNDTNYEIINIEDYDQKTYEFTALDFNELTDEDGNAEMTLEYTPVGMEHESGDSIDYELSKTFVATNLVDPDVNRAEVEVIWNE